MVPLKSLLTCSTPIFRYEATKRSSFGRQKEPEKVAESTRRPINTRKASDFHRALMNAAIFLDPTIGCANSRGADL